MKKLLIVLIFCLVAVMISVSAVSAVDDRTGAQTQGCSTDSGSGGVIAASSPDLQIKDVITAGNAAAGQPYNAGSLCTNYGTTATSVFYVDYYLSTDNVWSSNDIHITNNYGYDTYSSLAGETGNIKISAKTIPNTVPQGYYYLIAYADKIPNNVVESNENNNWKASATKIFVKRPDLMLVSVSTPTTNLATLKTITVRTTIRNQGSTTSNNFMVKYWLKNTATNAYYQLGNTTINGLTGGTDTTINPVFGIGNLPQGNYKLYSIIDYPTNNVPESNENNNNGYSYSSYLVKGADLMLVSVSTPTTNLGTGQTITVKTTIKNQGGGAAANGFMIKYWLYNTATNAYYQIGAYTIGSGMPSGLTYYVPDQTFTIPVNVPQGYYKLYTIIDYPTNNVAEVNENNNKGYSYASYLVKNPDLKITSNNAGPVTVARGGTIPWSGSAANIGSACTQGFNVGLWWYNIATLQYTSITPGYWASVPAGWTYNFGFDITVPSNLAPGKYRVYFLIDTQNSVLEASESNNKMYSNIITVT